jgi:hypothetical protein
VVDFTAALSQRFASTVANVPRPDEQRKEVGDDGAEDHEVTLKEGAN